jgi:hypothetical protein
MIIYEAGPCCAGQGCECGSAPDAGLQHLIEKLKQAGTEIVRCRITEQPGEFLRNKEVAALMRDYRDNALPVTVFNGRVILYGRYPSEEELRKVLPV